MECYYTEYYTEYYNEDELNRERYKAPHSTQNYSVRGKVFLAENDEKSCEIKGGGGLVIIYK